MRPRSLLVAGLLVLITVGVAGVWADPPTFLVDRLVRVSGESPFAGCTADDVTYYDFRNNTADPTTLPTDYFIVHCHPATSACTSTADWIETQLTERSFDMRRTPLARGFFTGDYEGLGNARNAFAAFFSQSHGSDPASVFFRRIGP